MPVRLSIAPMSIGDQVSMTGDTDEFPATMRPSKIRTDNQFVRLKKIAATERRQSSSHICSCLPHICSEQVAADELVVKT